MEQIENIQSGKQKFTLPKGPTMGGSIAIAFLLSAILFSIAGYSVAKRYTPVCPAPTKCVLCEKCEECIVDIEEKEQVINYKYSYGTEVVEYEVDTSKYLGFKTCDNTISTCTIYGVENSNIAKAVLGSKFLLEFNESNLGDCSAAAGTKYCILLGEFLLEPI